MVMEYQHLRLVHQLIIIKMISITQMILIAAFVFLITYLTATLILNQIAFPEHECYNNTTSVRIGNPNEPPPPNVTAYINVTHFGFCNST